MESVKGAHDVTATHYLAHMVYRFRGGQLPRMEQGQRMNPHAVGPQSPPIPANAFNGASPVEPPEELARRAHDNMNVTQVLIEQLRAQIRHRDELIAQLTEHSAALTQ